jgi:uncharacterized membrane protein
MPKTAGKQGWAAEQYMLEGKNSAKRIAAGAVIAALVFIVTWSLRIPIPATNGGYVNLGDIVIYIAAFAVGGFEAVAGASIGSALSDLLGGAAVYVYPYVYYQGLMAALVLAINGGKNEKKALRYVLSCLAGGAVMTRATEYTSTLFSARLCRSLSADECFAVARRNPYRLALYPAVRELSAVIKNEMSRGRVQYRA